METGKPPRSFRCKKILTGITVALFFLAGGTEYSVIIPTCFDYIHLKFGAPEWFYGLTIAGISISNFFSGPLMGAIYDHTHQPKLLVLFLNLFEIGGNFMYFTATSKWMVFGSRLITGIGMSAGAVLFGEIARTSKKEQRTAIFARFMSARQIGLVLGPAFNLFLEKCNFKIGPFKVDKFTSPALFMMIIWVFLEVLFLFFFFSLPPIEDKKSNIPNNHQSRSSGVAPQSPEHHKGDDKSDFVKATNTENSLLIGPRQIQSSLSGGDDMIYYGTMPSGGEKPHLKNYCAVLARMTKYFFWLVSELIREEPVVLLGVIFISLFDNLTLEAGLVPIAENILNWHELEISFFFSGAGVWLIFSFFVVMVASWKKASDRVLIMIGLVFQLAAYAWMTGFLGSGVPASWVVGQVAIGAALNLLGLPLMLVAGNSLYSKVLPVNIQGFAQGVRRSTAALAAIMGPLWAGAGLDLVHTGYDYYPFYGVPLILMALAVMLTVLSFPSLREKKTTTHSIVGKANEEGEIRA